MFSPAHIFQLPAGRGQFSWLASATKYQTAFSPKVERLSAFSNQPAACFSAPVARDRSGCCGQNRERSLKRAGTPGFSVDDLMWVFNAAWMFGFMQESGGWANKTNWHSSSLRSLSVQIKSGWLKQRPRITLFNARLPDVHPVLVISNMMTLSCCCWHPQSIQVFSAN